MTQTGEPDLRSHFERDESLLVGMAQSLSFSDAVRALRYWQARASEDGEEDLGKRLYEGRRAHCSRTLDGAVELQSTFDPIGGEVFADELARLEQQLFEEDWAE